MIYVVYFSTLNPHLKAWDSYPLLPIIIFFFPTAMQVKVNLSGEYIIFIKETYWGRRGLYWQAGLNENYFVTYITLFPENFFGCSKYSCMTGPRTIFHQFI